MGNWPFPSMVGLDWLFWVIFIIVKEMKLKLRFEGLVQVIVLGLKFPSSRSSSCFRVKV